MAVRNNAGGHWNHSFFWEIMSPNAGGEPAGVLAEEINKSFGSFEKFKEEFENAGKTRFGSGWAWLVKTSEGLKVCSTPNQDNPLIDLAVGIIIGGAFGTVVKSLVDDIIMPVVFGILKLPDFSNLFVVFRNPTEMDFTSLAAAREAGAKEIRDSLKK